MFEFLESLDLFIIEQIEKVTHFIQRNTSIDNFDLIYILSILLSIYPYYFFEFTKATAHFFIFWFFAYIFVLNGTSAIKEKVYQDLEKGYKNYLVEKYLGGRLIASLLVFSSFYFFTYKNGELDNFSLFLLIINHLFACTPLSPGSFSKDSIPDTA